MYGKQTVKIKMTKIMNFFKFAQHRAVVDINVIKIVFEDSDDFQKRQCQTKRTTTSFLPERRS